MPSTTAHPISPKRPSPITGGWLPNDPKKRSRWLAHFLRDVEKNRQQRAGTLALKQSVQDLKDLIEDSAQLSMLFRSMFEEIPFSHRFDPVGGEYNIVDYNHLLELFNEIMDKPPKYNENMMIALPFTLLLEWPMATRGGLAAFLQKDLNEKLGAVLNEWGAYLADSTKDSKKVLTNDPNDPYYKDSWLSKPARDIMKARDPLHREFEEVYKCVKDAPYLGFTDWDHFFTREFLPGARPVEDESDNTVTSGCESAPYAIKQKVKLREEFWIKGQPYSLKHMLDSEADAKKFAGGTVYQAFLSPLTYHRWHAPINGLVTKLRIVSGSYFSISPINAFPDPETFANTQSQAYLSSVATRALIYLENPTIGEMVMIPIGMVEVSTCSFNPQILSQMKETEKNVWVPQDGKEVRVKKGDELGMFHFGGSTHCLVFGPNIQLKFWQNAFPLDTEDNYFVPLNAVVAEVIPKDKSRYHAVHINPERK
jgi:phosphatidylserine decarboxylase